MLNTSLEVETAFLDLPNEILVEIFKLIDVPCRFKLRLNRRLDQIQLTIANHIEQIDIDVSQLRYVMIVSQIQFRSDQFVIS